MEERGGVTLKAFDRAVISRLPLALLSIVLALLDQLLKGIVVSYPEYAVLMRIAPFFEIVHTLNEGAAFSLLSGQTILLLAASSVMLAAILIALLFYGPLTQTARISLAILLGGGIGNWIDRFFSGVVIDYIRLLFVRFPVFNFADILITLSVAMLILLLLTNRFESHTGESDGTDY